MSVTRWLTALSLAAGIAGCGSDEATLPTKIFTQLRVTSMNWSLPEGGHLRTEHRLPLAFEVTGTASANVTQASAPVEVIVSLVRRGTEDISLRRCVVGSEEILVDTRGQATAFHSLLTIPHECLAMGTDHADVDVEIFLAEDDGIDSESVPEDRTATLLFNTANAMNTASAEHACQLSPEHGACVAGATLMHGEGMRSLRHGVRPLSSVGVLWPRANPANQREGSEEAPPPSLVVEVDTREFGDDPDAAEDQTLPGPVQVTMEIGPARGPAHGNYRPLFFSMLTNPTEVSDQLTFNHAHGGQQDQSYAQVYLPDDVQALMNDGAWAEAGLYNIRVCERPQGWDEVNEAEDDDEAFKNDAEFDADPQCQVHTLRFARALSSSLADPIHWGWDFRVQKGNDNLSGHLLFDTAGVLDPGQSDGHITIDVGLRLFGYPFILFGMNTNAHGAPAAFRDARAHIDVTVFNATLLDVSRTLGASGRVRVERELFSVMREICRDRTFFIEGVPITVQGCIRGQLGATGFVEVAGGTADFPAELSGSGAWLSAGLGVVPAASVGLTGSAGVGIGGTSAGVYINVTVAEITLPITGTGYLGFPPTAIPRPVPSAEVSVTCQQYAAMHALDPAECNTSVRSLINAFRGRPSATSQWLAWRAPYATAYDAAIAAWRRASQTRAFGNFNTAVTLEFLAGNFGVYASIGSRHIGSFTNGLFAPIRKELEIFRWNGIPGFGSHGGRLTVLDRNTPVIDLN